jgi:hypothetical protein
MRVLSMPIISNVGDAQPKVDLGGHQLILQLHQEQHHLKPKHKGKYTAKKTNHKALTSQRSKQHNDDVENIRTAGPSWKLCVIASG